jgi:hypothetical protein
MKSKMVVSVLLVFFATALGCSKSESKFTGTWIGKTGSFQFSKNNTGVINPPGGVNLPKNVQFKWSLQGNDTVRIDVGPPVGKTFFGKLVTNDDLVIEEDKFVRQK